ncbi:hypothetical protein GQ600_25565 [Phytophthora cactorum]|nr:hypothetical protein GQ600_25565 [Phytophthora cactorum]
MLTVDAFYSERSQAGNPISATGVVWTAVWAFIRRTNRLARVSGGYEICEDTVSVTQTQFRLTGVQTCVGLDHCCSLLVCTSGWVGCRASRQVARLCVGGDTGWSICL